MESRTIEYTQLLLDINNPRHNPVTSQRDAILAVIADQGLKLVTLAASIAKYGLSPVDRWLVIKSGRNFIVVEGNRRIAAVKLLHNPELAANTAIESQIRKLASTATAPAHIDCAIVESREVANHWLLLRHTGEQGGAGVVPWNALATGRFNHKPGSQTARAIAFIETVESAFPDNPNIQSALETITANRLTTLGRLVSDPNFRDHIDFEDTGGQLYFRLSADALEPVLEKILSDIATHISVTQLKTKEQRVKYLEGIPKPKVPTGKKDSVPLGSGISPKVKRSIVPRQRKPGSPFKDFDLTKLDQRINDIVRELKKLDVDKFPNSLAVMIRVLLELSIVQYFEKQGIQMSEDSKLKTKIKRCLTDVDPTGKGQEFQGIRSGLQDGTSIFAVATLHGFVHNPNFHPSPTDIRNIVNNLRPFIQKLNDLV